MLSKSKIRLIHSLEQKKYRRQEGAFVAEGHKVVGELLAAGYTPRLIVATEEWRCATALPAGVEVGRVTEEELRKASLLQHPQQVVGVFNMADAETTATGEGVCSSLLAPHSSLCLCLDGVQDPGNLGTIIRTADWFGIRDIVCSPLTADAFNPKVVQATMGSIARVRMHYTDLPQWLDSLPKDVPVYGTMLDGENLYTRQLEPHGVIVMGNEGNGISEEVARRLTERLFIPPFPADKQTAESLNVSIATAIICAEFRRGG